MGISRAGQRALFRQGDRPRSEAATACGSISGRPTVRPTRSKTSRSIPASPSAPAAARWRRVRTTAPPPASSDCGCSRIRTSTSGPRKRGTPERFYTDPTYYNDPTGWSGRTASACPAGSAMSVRIRPTRRRIRTIRSGRTSARMSARSTSGSTASSIGTPIPDRLRVPAVSHVTAGLARHLADLDRQHQQSADDERGLPARAAAGAGQAVGQGNARRRRARQPAVQRFRERRAR